MRPQRLLVFAGDVDGCDRRSGWRVLRACAAAEKRWVRVMGWYYLLMIWKRLRDKRGRGRQLNALLVDIVRSARSLAPIRRVRP